MDNALNYVGGVTFTLESNNVVIGDITDNSPSDSDPARGKLQLTLSFLSSRGVAGLRPRCHRCPVAMLPLTFLGIARYATGCSMRIAKLASAIALVSAAIACTDPSSSPTAPAARVPNGPQLITGGQPTGSAYGGVGALLGDIGGDDVIDYLCTGSLISPTVFLTAAHCIDEPGTVYYISFAQDVIPIPALSSMIKSTTAYASSDDDIAVVILPNNSTSGIPVYDIPSLGFVTDLYAQGELKNVDAILVGYGAARLRGQQTALDGVRKWATSKILLVTVSQVIVSGARGKSGQGGACYGDSGGPLFLADQDPDLIVAIATSVLPAGCQAFAFYTRIDTASALEFLEPFVTP